MTKTGLKFKDLYNRRLGKYFSESGELYKLDHVYGDDGIVYIALHVKTGKIRHIDPNTDIKRVDSDSIRITFETV